MSRRDPIKGLSATRGWQARLEAGELFRLGGYPVAARKKGGVIDDPHGLLVIRHSWVGQASPAEMGEALGRLFVGASKAAAEDQVPVALVGWAEPYGPRGTVAAVPLAFLARLLGQCAEQHPEDDDPEQDSQDGAS